MVLAEVMNLAHEKMSSPRFRGGGPQQRSISRQEALPAIDITGFFSMIKTAACFDA